MSSLNKNSKIPLFLHTQSQYLIKAVLGIIAAGWLLQGYAAAPPPAEAEYRQALTLAREGQHDAAIETLAALVQRHPDTPRYRYDYVTVLSWAERDREALEAAAVLDPATTPLYVLDAMALAQRREGRWLDALDTYDRILRIDPANTDARKGRILAVHRLGAPHRAAELADESPGLLTDDERAEIERDRQAIAIRWGRLPTTGQTAPARKTDVAIIDLRSRLEALEADGLGDTPGARLLRHDLLVSLHERGRNREAIALYESAISKETDIPSYVLAAAGQANLAERRPEAARDLFLRALTQEPESYPLRLSLFYAYVEAEDFDAALALIDEVAADEPAWLGEAPDRRPNSARLGADLTAAYARAYADDLAGAERRLAPLVEGAPLNAELRTARATVWLWRGWPRRALGEYQAAISSLPPDRPDAHAGRGHALLNLGAYAEADGTLRHLQEVAPDHGATRRLSRDRQLRHMPVLRVEGRRTVSSGTQEGSETLGFGGWLYGSPLAHRYRPFLHYHFEQAELPEGKAVYRRIGAGVEYRARDLLGTIELDRDAGGGEVNPGIAVNGRWTPSDHWSFTAGADSYSDDVPLRGRLNEGIDGWSVDLGADWRAHEGRSLHAGIGNAVFSDDNRRTSARVRGAQRLITRPHYRMDGLIGLYASSNTRENAPYFNPASDLSTDFTLSNDWLLFRRYGHSFRHRLALSAGTYYQEDFGSGGIWALQYEQRWSPHDRFALGYGFIRARRVYDGAPEYQTTIHFDLEWRF